MKINKIGVNRAILVERRTENRLRFHGKFKKINYKVNSFARNSIGGPSRTSSELLMKFLRSTYGNCFRFPPGIFPEFLQQFLWIKSNFSVVLLELHQECYRISSIVTPRIYQDLLNQLPRSSYRNASGVTPANPPKFL